MSNMLYKFLLSTVLIISLVKNPLAKTKFIGTHKDWTAYSNKEKNGKTCFIASEPLKSSGKYNKRIEARHMFLLQTLKMGQVMRFQLSQDLITKKILKLNLR